MDTYIYCEYEGKPAILDTVTNVYYFGYENKEEAEYQARILNEENFPMP